MSTNPADILVTYALGSCIGVCLYDPMPKIGGMLHYLLPNSTGSEDKAKENPFKYADTDMEILLKKLLTMGINKNRMIVKIAGGAAVLGAATKEFDIGKRNYLAIRKILWKNAIRINAQEVGGNSPRTMYMDIADGKVRIRSGKHKKEM